MKNYQFSIFILLFFIQIVSAQRNSFSEALFQIENKNLVGAIEIIENAVIQKVSNPLNSITSFDKKILVQLIQDLELTRKVLVGKEETEYLLALCYFINDELQKSSSILSRLKSLKRTISMGLISLMQFMKSNQIHLAKLEFEFLQSINQQQLSHMTMLNLAYSFNQPSWAIGYLNYKISQQPEYELYFYRAKHYLKYSDEERAWADIQTAKKIKYTDELKIVESLVLVSKGKIDEAKEIITKLIQKSPHNKEALNAYSHIQRLQKS